ncbi:MAG: class I SAM-dependent methyltransferase [Pirellulales bacterium]
MYGWSASSHAENQRRLNERPVTGRIKTHWKHLRRRWLRHRKLERLIARYAPTGNLVDIGCGRGSLFSRLSSNLVPYGIEIDSLALKVAQHRATARGGEVVHADAIGGLQELEQSLGLGGVSVIVMHSYLEHEVAPLTVLRIAERLLVPKGAVIIKVPNLDCWNRHFRGREWPGFRFPDHVNYFTPETLARLVTKSGLAIARFGLRDRSPTSDNMWLVARKAGN